MALADQLTSMSPREQRLLGLLGLVFGAIVFIGVPFYVYDSVSTSRQENEEIRQLLRRLDRGRELLAQRRAERAAIDRRYDRPAPALASFIESAAKANGLDVPESTDRPDIPGEGYVERTTVVKMKQVNLRPLVKMLEKIEGSGYPVAITTLQIKARASGPDLYDVTLGVSAYDRTTPAPSGAGSASPKMPIGAEL